VFCVKKNIIQRKAFYSHTGFVRAVIMLVSLQSLPCEDGGIRPECRQMFHYLALFREQKVIHSLHVIGAALDRIVAEKLESDKKVKKNGP
jgi:hypothetical protein